jgi:hypothetical protein
MTATMKRFQPTRRDGRSDRQVVYELMQDAEPGVVFAHDVIADALQSGVADPITPERASAAARAANRLLLRERRRTMLAVRGIGYRILAACEHVGASLSRRERAESQVRAGLSILRECRLDELSETQRKLHEGQLLVMSGVYDAVRYTNARVDRHEKALRALTDRVVRLEDPLAPQPP